MEDAKELKFIRITNKDELSLVPIYLFEQVKGRSWDVDRLLQMDILASEAIFFWGLINNKNEVKGFLWITLDYLSEKINVIAFEVDNEYQSETDIQMALEFLRNNIKSFNAISQDIKLKEKINWLTNDPDKFKPYGGYIPGTRMVEV
jgi:hypothetical protein